MTVVAPAEAVATYWEAAVVGQRRLALDPDPGPLLRPAEVVVLVGVPAFRTGDDLVVDARAREIHRDPDRVGDGFGDVAPLTGVIGRNRKSN